MSGRMCMIRCLYRLRIVVRPCWMRFPGSEGQREASDYDDGQQRPGDKGQADSLRHGKGVGAARPDRPGGVAPKMLDGESQNSIEETVDNQHGPVKSFLAQACVHEDENDQ